MAPLYGFSDLHDVERINRVVNRHERDRGGHRPPTRHEGRPHYYPRIGFFNDSGQTIPPFGVVLLKGFKGQDSDTKRGPAQGVVASVKRPDVFGCQYNAMVADETPDGAGCPDQTFGAAQLPMQGVPLIALYDSADGTPAFGEAWGPRSGTFKLKKNTGGFRVIGVYDSTNHYALVQPEPMLTVFGKFAADLAPDASADLTIWSGADGAEVTTSQTITGVKNVSSCTIKGTPQFAGSVWMQMKNSWHAFNGKTF
jgi:hypothetical protein